MLRKGFTLIELLIVITIIAILAGAAIPYVQDYVEDARIARAKSDLDEIRNALIRFELDRGVQYIATSTTDLVGPYLDKAPIDPWGVPYCITATNSLAFAAGPNRDSDTLEFTTPPGAATTNGDDVAREFRPPLSLSKAYWIDVDKSGTVNDGDKVKVRFSRPALAADLVALVQTDWNFTIAGAATTLTAVATVGIAPDASIFTTKEADLTLTTVGALAFIPGRDTINYIDGTANLNDSSVAPYGPNECRSNLVVIQSF